MLYCFVDTNIFIEFQMFDEIGWPSVLEANQVCLVVPGIVINELEKHKKHPTRKRLKKRSKSIVRKLERLALSVPPGEGAPICSETWIRVDPDTPHKEWLLKHGYDPDNPDQILVGSAQLFKDLNPNAIPSPIKMN